MFDRVDVEACHDAKVVASSSQRPEQVWIVLLVDLQHLSVSIDKLIAADVVKSQSLRRVQEAETSTNKQASDANCRYASTHDSQAKRVKCLVDPSPSVPGPDAR